MGAPPFGSGLYISMNWAIVPAIRQSTFFFHHVPPASTGAMIAEKTKSTAMDNNGINNFFHIRILFSIWKVIFSFNKRGSSTRWYFSLLTEKAMFCQEQGMHNLRGVSMKNVLKRVLLSMLQNITQRIASWRWDFRHKKYYRIGDELRCEINFKRESIFIW